MKVRRDGAELTSTGRPTSFHKRAPATMKARRPIVGSLTAGTVPAVRLPTIGRRAYVIATLPEVRVDHRMKRLHTLPRPDVGDRCN